MTTVAAGIDPRASRRRTRAARSNRAGTLREAVALVFFLLCDARRNRGRALLVGMSGVDGSGKTQCAAEFADALRRAGLRVAVIGVDPWQNPQDVRFTTLGDPAPHFYRHALRFEEFFARVVDPLVAQRALHIETVGIRTDADAWEPLVYDFDDVDVVLVEGIFLFRRDLAPRYDLRIWVHCPISTALRRALARNSERRPRNALRRDYAEIYHAAQRVHFAADDPHACADLVLDNSDWDEELA
jgi:uridine kinase